MTNNPPQPGNDPESDLQRLMNSMSTEELKHRLQQIEDLAEQAANAGDVETADNFRASAEQVRRALQKRSK